MRVAYIFSSPHGSCIMVKKFLSLMEVGTHPMEVVGMFFFVDNYYTITEGNPTAERLAAVARKTGTMVMGCDQCCEQRPATHRRPHLRRLHDRLFPESLRRTAEGRWRGPGDHSLGRSAQQPTAPQRARRHGAPDNRSTFR